MEQPTAARPALLEQSRWSAPPALLDKASVYLALLEQSCLALLEQCCLALLEQLCLDQSCLALLEQSCLVLLETFCLALLKQSRLALLDSLVGAGRRWPEGRCRRGWVGWHIADNEQKPLGRERGFRCLYEAPVGGQKVWEVQCFGG